MPSRSTTRSSGCRPVSGPGRRGWIGSTRTCTGRESPMSDATPVATDDTVLITRIFDAPREQVVKAWPDPEEVAAWFGPGHVDVPRDKVRIDLRVGGRYELTMVRRDGGGEFAIGYEIVELVAPELIVLRSDPMPEAGMHKPT